VKNTNIYNNYILRHNVQY